jgi:hypothetical protein
MVFQIISKMAAELFAIASSRLAAACRASIERIQGRKRP